MPPLRRIQFSPLNTFRTALRIGVMATAATFSGDTDLDAAEQKSIPGLGLTLVQVLPGSFNPGGASGISGAVDDANCQTRGAVAKPYWLGAAQVTIAQWRQFLAATQSPATDLGWHDLGDPPVNVTAVVGVTSRDAEKFCAWLTERERAAGRLPAGYAYGLAAEAPWEGAITANLARDSELGFRVALRPTSYGGSAKSRRAASP
jgi:formylglycine-generating enzyme required for sulfatase activity